MGFEFKNSPEEIQRLRALPYQDGYCKSPWWRKRRYARIKKAGWKCQRCAASVASVANVHHIHYDRLGEERDSDLEVLCRDCHEKLHHDESRRQHTGVYMLLARETIRLDQSSSLDAFKDAFRKRCGALHLPIDHRYDKAITVVAREREVSLVSETRREQIQAVTNAGVELPPIDKREAHSICRELGIQIAFKSMPSAYGTGMGVAAIKARALKRLQAARCPQCQLQAAQVSRVQPGWLFCTGCHHKWEIPLERAM